MSQNRTPSDFPYIHRPILKLVLAYGCGIVADRYLEPAYSICIGLVVLIGLVSASCWFVHTRRFIPIILLAFAASVGLLAHCATVRHFPTDHIRHQLSAERTVLRLQGIVVEAPTFAKIHGYAPGGGPTSFVIGNLQQIRSDGTTTPVSGKVKVSFDRSKPLPSAHRTGLTYGRRVEVIGRIGSIRGASNPGQVDFQKFFESRGIYGEYSFLDPRNVTILEETSRHHPIRLAARMKRHLNETIYYRAGERGFLTPEQAAMVSALTLGDRAGIARETIDDFQKSGTMHFLAISGLHLTILTSLLFSALRLFRVGRRPTALLVACMVLTYAVMTELRPPVVRASVMIVLYLLGDAMNRRRELLNVLAAAALVILLIRPVGLFAVGFQLSFIAVACMVLFHDRLDLARLWPSHRATPQRRGPGAGPWVVRILVQYLRRSLNLSISVWIGLFPLLAFYFHLCTPLTVLANVVLFPIVALVLYVSVLIFILGSVLSVPLSSPYLLLGWAVDTLQNTTGAFVLDGRSDIHLVGFTVPLIVLYYGLLLLWINRERLRVPGKLLLPALGAVLLLVFFRQQTPVVPEQPMVTVLHVGQGTVAVIETPEGAVSLYDGGSRSKNSGRYVVIPYLDHRRIRQIDTVVTGAMAGSSTPVFEQVRQEVPIRTGSDRFASVSSLTVEPIGSELTLIIGSGHRLLLAGMVSSSTMKAMTVEGKVPQADIVVAPNQGRWNSTTRRFYEAVAPKILLVATSRSLNGTDLARWCVDHDIQLYSTAKQGALTVTLGPKITVASYFPAEALTTDK